LIVAILKPRSKVVNVRLSREEYENVCSASVAQGARSISDFARSAVLNKAQSNGNSELANVNERIAELSGMLREMNQRVGRIATVLTDEEKQS
jgi:type II secretory pathway component PulK